MPQAIKSRPRVVGSRMVYGGLSVWSVALAVVFVTPFGYLIWRSFDLSVT